MSDRPIHEVLAEISAKVPPEEWAKLDKTHYADPDTLATLAKLERENAALRHDVERHVKIASDLATELEAARKDAERYRWLREHNDSMSLEPPITVALVAGWGLEAWSGDNLDAAVDAAIAAGKGEK